MRLMGAGSASSHDLSTSRGESDDGGGWEGDTGGGGARSGVRVGAKQAGEQEQLHSATQPPPLLGQPVELGCEIWCWPMMRLPSASSAPSVMWSSAAGEAAGRLGTRARWRAELWPCLLARRAAHVPAGPPRRHTHLYRWRAARAILRGCGPRGRRGRWRPLRTWGVGEEQEAEGCGRWEMRRKQGATTNAALHACPAPPVQQPPQFRVPSAT